MYASNRSMATVYAEYGYAFVCKLAYASNSNQFYNTAIIGIIIL